MARCVISMDRYLCERLPYCKFSNTGRLLGAYNLGVATPRALVDAGDKTSRDVRSWYMISEDAKSWIVVVCIYSLSYSPIVNWLKYWHNDWVFSKPTSSPTLLLTFSSIIF
nr:hypothetical protein [Tanacetum cinerariifolium]